MHKKKKGKLKIKNIVLCCLIIVIMIVVISLLCKNDFKVEIKDNTLNIGATYEENFKATFKGKDVTKDVKVTNNIYSEKVGKYQITFTYKKGNKKYKVVKDIEVKDTEAPVITLSRGEEITVVLDSEYKDPGYKAIDNYDGDVTKDVKVSGKVDAKKEGTYKIKYTVTDGSGNKTTKTRKVLVTKDSPLNMSVKDFKLDGVFSSVLLTETASLGSDYSQEFIFAGDSTALYYVINKQITGKRLWHKEGVDPETALTSSIYINHIETNKTFVENFKEKQPEKVVMTLGTNSAAYMEPSYFVKNYKKLLTQIKEVSPKTLLIVQSIPPVDKSYDEKTSGINNDKINKLNYYILEMCSELNIPFLNSAEALKDGDGALKAEYSIKDGIHLSKEGNEVIMHYLENHVYEED